MKKRYYFMDVIRLIAMLGIVYYHMVFALYQTGIRQLESVAPLFQNSNMHIAKISVGLFFMISGAGLMLSTKDKEHLDLKKYYLKRFVRVLVPFYLVYLLYLIIFILLTHEPLSNIYTSGASPFAIIFTLLGMDAYLSSFGVATFSLGIGEWFLGALIIMYIIFPALRLALLKNKWVSLGVAVIYYIITLVTYPLLPYAATNPGFVNFTVKVFDFFLGMFLVLIMDKIPKYISIALSVPVILFFVLYPKMLPVNDSLLIVIQILTFFLLFLSLEGVFKRLPKLMKVIAFCCASSYEFFLVHHMIVDYITLQHTGVPFGNFDILLLFIKEFAVIVLFTILVKLILNVPKLIRKKKNI